MVTTALTGAFDNVEFIGQLPEAVGATAINFIDYGSKKKVMFVTGRFGPEVVRRVNPEKPVALDSIDMPAGRTRTWTSTRTASSSTWRDLQPSARTRRPV